MYKFQLPGGRVVRISPENLNKFMEENPDAVYLGGGSTSKRRFTVDGISYSVDMTDQKDIDQFQQDTQNMVIETPDSFVDRKRFEY